ncbi:unnamed protein product [Auanema sp. JU1783]|nr:unnamed protein product [Auanema sp. JU1783]
MMEDDWAPILNKDCSLFSSAMPLNDDFQLTTLDPPYLTNIKAEPQEDSDYHGSSSGSPSSSLSSPDMKGDHLGVDLSFGQFTQTNGFLHSPASSSGSPFAAMTFPSCANAVPQTSPLPPVSHFSQQNQNQRLMHHSPIGSNCLIPQDGLSLFDDDRSLSPPTSDRSSPMDNVSPMINMQYDNGFTVMPNGLMINGLQAAQQQLKSRSKMHEMAVKQRLITDQDPRSQGLVQLSAEERRTLIQEGYQVPTRLPLTKGEEEALKIVRRKIKNKLSAQESRRKRKEYMDTLEQRCQAYFSENAQLKMRIRQLEISNKQLNSQMQKLQEMLGGTSDRQ